MNQLNRNTVRAKKYTERVIQFGGGVFLRGFADWIIHQMNNKVDFDAGVVLVKPTNRGSIEVFKNQDCLYTLYLNGIKNEQAISEHEIIDCIQRVVNPYECYDSFLDIAKNPYLRFVISNTTEAGISYDADDKLDDQPQKSFPGKLTAFLYKRFEIFQGASEKGMIIIPCELIDKNGDNLKKIVLQYASDWNLGNDFVKWINYDTVFCNTLVDRIVPGYPKDKINTIIKELGYKDNLVVEGEQFHLWVIEGPSSIKKEFPTEKCGLNVVFTDNLEPYRTRKVRILNGAHTAMVSVGYLYGIDKVRESIEDKIIGQYINEVIFNEICPTLDSPEEELTQFANDVLDRFKNPYLEHELISISLNSISKFKTRVLPSILEYSKRKNNLPVGLVFSLAALIVFYKGNRNGEKIALKDNQSILDFFNKQWATGDIATITKTTLSNKYFWDTNLMEIKGMGMMTELYISNILNNGMKESIKALKL